MNAYTQPMTLPERKRADEFRLQGNINADDARESMGLAHYDGGDGPNPGPDIDWLKINREFGI